MTAVVHCDWQEFTTKAVLNSKDYLLVIHVVVNADSEDDIAAELERGQGAWFTSLEEAERTAAAWRSFGPVYVLKVSPTNFYPRRLHAGARTD
jgi:hypothetical protein